MLRKRVHRQNAAKRSRFFQLTTSVYMELLEQRVMLSTTTPSPLPPLPSQPTPLQGLVGTPNSLDPQMVDQGYGFNGLAFDQGGTIFPDNGAGETIAIVDAFGSPTIINDVQVFDAETYNVPGESEGAPSPPISNYDAEGNFFLTVQKLAPTSGTLPAADEPVGDQAGWAEETSLDVEWAHAIAPGAHILLVEAASDSLTDMINADVYAANYPGVVAVSNSWTFDVTKLEDGAYGGPAEGNNFAPTNSPETLDGRLVTPVGHTDNDGLVGGIVFLAASGDAGDELNFPASSFNVLSVGGDQITIALNGQINDTFTWPGSGGAQDTVYTSPAYHEPEVGFDADPTTGVWVYNSTPDPTEGTSIDGGWEVIGGTSFATPVWAAMIAMIDQGLNLRGIGSLTTSQALGDTSYDPLRPAQSETTPFGILGLAQANIETVDDLTGFYVDPATVTSYPLWPKTGPVPNVDQTPAGGNVGYGNPVLDNPDGGPDDPGGAFWGGFIQDMVGGPTDFSVFDTQVINGNNVVDTLDYFAVTQQPTDATAGQTMPSITITAFTPTNDGVDTSFNGPITIELLGAGTLIGTTTIDAVDGSATFSNLSINKTGIYQIEATSPNVVPVSTLAFNVDPAAATHMTIESQPTSFWQYSAMGSPIVVLLEDQFDDVVLGSGVPITLTVNSGPAGGVLVGKTTVNTVSGIATFSNLSVNLPGTYTLSVSSSGFQSLITGEFAVVPIPVTQRFTLNGAGLSAQNILLQQLRNAKSVTQTPPTQSDIDLVLENDNQPVPEADAAAAVTVAPAATTGGKFSAVSSSPSDSSIDSQLLDTTSSSNDKVILN
jgi:hypothetical protein